MRRLAALLFAILTAALPAPNYTTGIAVQSKPAACELDEPCSQSTNRPASDPSSVSHHPLDTSERKVENSLVGKCGLLWPNGDDPALQYFATPNCTNMYTWTPYCPQSAKTYNITCHPMFWGANAEGQIVGVVSNSSSPYVMGFNEPDLAGQAGLSPSDAAAMWNRTMLPFKTLGKKLVSPATTNAPEGMDWMDDFFAACGGNDMCGVDVIAVHWYSTDFGYFQSYVNSWKKYNKPIWVTEMACQDFSGNNQQCTLDQVFDLMEQALAWMEQDPQIEAYYWFGAFRNLTNVNPLNALMYPQTDPQHNGRPTDLGLYYINN